MQHLVQAAPWLILACWSNTAALASLARLDGVTVCAPRSIQRVKAHCRRGWRERRAWLFPGYLFVQSPRAPTISELCCEARRLAEETGTPVEKNGQYQVFVEVGTAKWTAWDAYWRATHRKSLPSVNMLAHGGRRGWLFPSPRPPRAEAAS